MRLRTVVPLLSALVAAACCRATAFAAPSPRSSPPRRLDHPAFDVNGSHFLKDDPAESWATGTDTGGSVLSRFGGGVTATTTR